ncbi:hypothetical protein ZWY2020_055317 [Hordeum vulgare]|nr:hypothetical protein ZWY2020_055317 [Hordeum vulgare]
MRHGGRRARGLLMHAWMHARGVSVARSDADKDDVSAAHLSPPGGATSAPAQQQHTCTFYGQPPVAHTDFALLR